MRKATRITAASLGVLAGLAGLEHGIFEMIQGSAPMVQGMFPSMGPPCDPQTVWNACEPAVSLLPNFLLAGSLTVLLSLAILVWALFFVPRKHGGWVLILLSLALLLAGGGIFPPLIGILGGVAGLSINKPPAGSPGRFTRFCARLWPWPLVILIVWLLGQFPVGYFFNDFLKSIIGGGLLLILAMLPLSVYSAYAHDVVS